jgi:predicted nucleic acid-binding protein
MRDTLWRDGAPIVRRLTGLPEIRVRALLGSLLKSTQDDCARLYRVLREADDLRPVDPVAWLKAACNDGRQRKPGRLADSLAGIYGIEPNGRAPTLDLYPDEYRTDQ